MKRKDKIGDLYAIIVAFSFFAMFFGAAANSLSIFLGSMGILFLAAGVTLVLEKIS